MEIKRLLCKLEWCKKLGHIPRPYMQACVTLVLLMSNMLRVDCCSRRLVSYTISYQGCVPRRSVAAICEGQCNSYSQPSVENPRNLETFCQCCDVDTFTKRRTSLVCRNEGRNRRIRVAVKVATACRCRPCNEPPDYITPAEQGVLHSEKRRLNGSKQKEMKLNKTRTLLDSLLYSSKVLVDTNRPKFNITINAIG